MSFSDEHGGLIGEIEADRPARWPWAAVVAGVLAMLALVSRVRGRRQRALVRFRPTERARRRSRPGVGATPGGSFGAWLAASLVSAVGAKEERREQGSPA